MNVLITAWLVWNQQLYADFLQQSVYFILLVYGWFAWISGRQEAAKKITDSSLNLKMILFVVFILSSMLMGWLLKNYTHAAFPYMDSTGTVICFIAQWMIAVKKTENWYLWIAANCMYIVIYYLKDMPLYAVLSGIYLVMAFIGLTTWKKLQKQEA